MRIAIVNRHLDDRLGGSEIQCDFIATGLQERGHEVIYVAPGGDDRDYNKPYSVIPSSASGDDIAAHVIKADPDVVYWRFNKNGFRQAVTVIHEKGIPFIFAASAAEDVSKYVIRRHLKIRKRVKQFFKNLWQHSAFRYVDALTVNNRDFLNRIDLPVQKFIPNGMSDTKVRFDWPRPYICWVANIKKIKRPELFVDLARKLESSGLDFLMSGSMQEPGFEWLNDRSSLPDNFYYMGPTSFEESSGMLASSEFMVHTCLPEGFPNVFIQAWVQGKATVSYGFDPCGFIMSEGLGYCTEENGNLFVEKVRYLINHPEVREKMGKDARVFALSRFSVDSCVDNVEELIKSIVAGEGRGQSRANPTF